MSAWTADEFQRSVLQVYLFISGPAEVFLNFITPYLSHVVVADHFIFMGIQVFPDVESVELAMIKDTPPGQKQRNRGFAFVRFSSHAVSFFAFLYLFSLVKSFEMP